MKVIFSTQVFGLILVLFGVSLIGSENTRLGLYVVYCGAAFSALAAALMAYCLFGERMRRAEQLDLARLRTIDE